jgi:hypothetical protein
VLARARNILRAQESGWAPIFARGPYSNQRAWSKAARNVRNIHGNASCVCREACFGTPLGARCVHPVHSSSSAAQRSAAAPRRAAVPRYRYLYRLLVPLPVPVTVPGAPGASCARRGVPGRPRAPSGLSRIYSVPQAINASRGFARCEGVSQICLGRVKINCISINWRAYSLHRQSDIQEREPSTHTPKVCPVPRPTRLSQANAACGQTQHRAAPCHVLMEQICVKWTWPRLYVVLSTVQPVADTFTRT